MFFWCDTNFKKRKRGDREIKLTTHSFHIFTNLLLFFTIPKILLYGISENPNLNVYIGISNVFLLFSSWNSLFNLSSLKSFNDKDCFARHRFPSDSQIQSPSYSCHCLMESWKKCLYGSRVGGYALTQQYGHPLTKVIWLQPLLSAQSANSKGQHWTSSMASFLRGSAS